MDNFRRYLARIQTQLAGLTISQKLLISLLLVVMVGTIYFTVVLSAKPDMVVLIPQSMSPEEINRAEMYLKGKYDYQVSGDKILVPAEKAFEIRGEMFAEQALPKDTTVAFAELVKANNPFLTDSAQTRQWNYATQETLTKMLRYFPYIEDGTVIIARGERGGIGRDAVPSSASVTVKLKNSSDGLTSSQVLAIVDMIRGAVAGLNREDVHITDGQREYHAPSGDGPMPSDMLEAKKAIEDDLSRKLYLLFSGFGDVKIAVNAVPDLSTKKIGQISYDPKPVKAATQETDKETTTSDGTAGPGGEPGVVPNVGMKVDNSGGGGRRSSSTTSDTTTETLVKIGETQTDTVSPAGTDLKQLTASISMPRSYYVAIYRRMTHDPKADPEDSDPKFKALMDSEIKKETALAKNAIGAQTDGQVLVDCFDDTIVLKPQEVAVAGTFASGSLPTFLSLHAKQGVLGILAFCVLGWMLMMVRKAVPGAAAQVDGSVFFGNSASGGGGTGGKSKRKGEGGVNNMDVSDDVYGEANEGDAVLTGIELDDDTLQSRKMVDEVSAMIKENPENAATLVKRWMAKSK